MKKLLITVLEATLLNQMSKLIQNEFTLRASSSSDFGEMSHL